MGIPKNIVIMWSGAIQDIPGDWFLCDGQNGTPNLLNRFVVGAGNNYTLESVGGSVDSVVVSHSHTASISTSASHIHTFSVASSLTSLTGGPGSRSSSLPTGNQPTTGASNGNHTHSSTVNPSGESGIGKNMPPYLALAYIMYGGD